MVAQSLFIGIAVHEDARGNLDLGFNSHDGTYTIDFKVVRLDKKTWANGNEDSDFEARAAVLSDFMVSILKKYQEEHLYKFVGAGLSKKVAEISPELPSKLWLELDAVPLVLDPVASQSHPTRTRCHPMTVDEEADMMARKCLL
jgi:hypothetical protein